MAITAEERRAAAAARRAKVLAKGDLRMAQVTGTIKDDRPSVVATDSHPSQTRSKAAAAASASELHSTSLEPSVSTNGIAAAAPASAVSSRPATTSVAAAGASSAPRKVGAGTGGDAKWSGYETSRRSVPTRPRRHALTAVEKVDAVVATTASIRLLLAVAYGLILFSLSALSTAQPPSKWAISRQEWALSREWAKLQQRGWSAQWRPLSSTLYKTATMRAAVQLARPQWAAAAALAQRRPVAALAVANAAVLAAAALGMAVTGVWGTGRHAAPAMVWRLLTGIAPGLAAGLGYLAAGQRAMGSVIDSAAAMVLTLACCQLAGPLMPE